MCVRHLPNRKRTMNVAPKLGWAETQPSLHLPTLCPLCCRSSRRFIDPGVPVALSQPVGALQSQRSKSRWPE